MIYYIDVDGDLNVESDDDVVYISIEDIKRLFTDAGYDISITKKESKLRFYEKVDSENK